MEFIKVNAYKCKYCKQLFMTERHNCKRNPAHRNCFTCKHHKEFIELEYDTGFEYEANKRLFSDCKHALPNGYDMNLLDLCNNGWKGHCAEYEEEVE